MKELVLPFLPKPELVLGAKFQGKYDIPIIKNYEGKIPEELLPFSQRCVVKNKKDTFLHFYLYDDKFNKVLTNPESYVDEFRDYAGIISPDCSIYTDLPLCHQIMNTYLNRAIGYYFQSRGINVIPNVRWGDYRSYDFCFDGLEKNGIYCISTYGCIKNPGKRKLFKDGLEYMLTTLEPELVLVHGLMPKEVFEDYISKYNFIRYESFLEKRFKSGV